MCVYWQEVSTGQSGRPSYPGGLATVALASSVAKYWVLTNLFPGPIPQVSVYHHPHHRAVEAQATKDSAAQQLNQDMSHHQTSSSQQQQQQQHHQAPVGRSHHSSVQSTTQVCWASVHDYQTVYCRLPVEYLINLIANQRTISVLSIVDCNF